MILSTKQITELFDIIHKNQAIVIASNFGSDFLSQSDRYILKKYGVDVNSLYRNENDVVFTSFHFGLLSDALKQLRKVKTITYTDLKQYISQGKYIPLTQTEIEQINSIKTQNLSSIKSQQNNIFRDINNSISNGNLQYQQKLIRDIIEQGTLRKLTIKQISHEIAHATGDWSRDFDKMVQYISQTAYQQGKAAALKRQFGDNCYVYKNVQQGACKHCIRLYLTNGIGSAPKVFKLSELIANSSNIGRKVNDWLPTVDCVHPYCRCELNFISPFDDFQWNNDKKQFDYNDKKAHQSSIEQNTRPRPKVRAVIGGVEVFV